MRKFVASITLGALIWSGCWAADDPCAQFKWDLAAERAIYATVGTAVATGHDAASAPGVEPGKLYAVSLHPQEHVTLQVAISKRMLDDGAFAGLVRLRVPHSGRYRISIDAGFWVDVADGTTAVVAKDFSGAQNCRTPRKVVLYELAAGKEVAVQLTGASASAARLVIVAENAPPMG